MKRLATRRAEKPPRFLCGMMWGTLWVIWSAAGPLASVSGQAFDEAFDIWPTDLRINGTVIACGDGEIPEEIPRLFLHQAGGEDAVVVVLQRGAGTADLQSFTAGAAQVETVDLCDSAALSHLRTKKFSEASGILILDSEPSDCGAAPAWQTYAEALLQTVARGGVVCAVGEGAMHLADYHWTPEHSTVGDGDVKLSKGVRLVPDSVFFDASRLAADPVRHMECVLTAEPTAVGIAIPHNTAIVLQGRKMRVYGEHEVCFVLAGNGSLPTRVQRVGFVKDRRFDPYRDVIDLTAWRRDARERQLPPFPPEQPPVPHVEHGTLIIVGGGGMPRGLMERMVELAGGEKAKMVFVPCTERDEVNSDDWMLRSWKSMGVESAVVFHTKDRRQAHTDEAFLEPLKEATGIWFGGGRQWNLADSYYGTEAHRLMKRVLARGGVIGGSSAGASIQADYLARANPVANLDIMAAGYERGLGFLTGVAIDQHFSQRGRQQDMTQLVDRYPQLLGIGIDETTALVVQKSVAEVVGKGQVYFYDRRQAVIEGEPDYVALGAGERFDLDARKTLDRDAPDTSE